jgi:V8-like Glu-specific endopeptidase
MRLPWPAVLTIVFASGVAPPGLAQSPLPQDQHYGEIADPSVWPASAVGRFNTTQRDSGRSFCTGTLVAPNLVLTAGHCIGGALTLPNTAHFVTAVSKGVGGEHSVAKRFVLSPDYVDMSDFKVEGVKNDWAIVVLKDALTAKPVAVKSLSRWDLRTAGPFTQIGYGADRPFLPSIVRDCTVGMQNDQTLIYTCLLTHGYSGAPLFAQINGTPTVIGIGSGGNEKRGYAASAVQFEKVIADLAKSE